MGRRPSSKKKNKKRYGIRNKIRWPKIRPWIFLSVLAGLILICLGILFTLQISLKEERKEASIPPHKAEKPILPPPAEPEVKKPIKERPYKAAEKKGHLYKVAIVIDDLGNNKEMFDRLIRMNLPFSFAILPHQEYTRYVSREAKKKRHDVLLHLPMEPENSENLYGDGFILSSMTPNEMLKEFENDLKSVPGAIGVNNHMGSFLTQDRKAMAIVLGEIKRKGLFFVDSRTTSKTVAYDVAKKLGLKAAERNVFLDDIEDEEEVIKQIELLISTAKKNGRAIAIGHPRRETIAALEKMLPALKTDGIEIVPVSKLVN